MLVSMEHRKSSTVRIRKMGINMYKPYHFLVLKWTPPLEAGVFSISPHLGIECSINIQLVGGDWNHGILNDFPFSWEKIIISTDELIFFPGVGEPTNQIIDYPINYP